MRDFRIATSKSLRSAIDSLIIIVELLDSDDIDGIDFFYCESLHEVSPADKIVPALATAIQSFITKVELTIQELFMIVTWKDGRIYNFCVIALAPLRFVRNESRDGRRITRRLT